MLKKSLILLLFFLVSYVYAFADESLTITTYYPSPFGSYNEIRAKKMAIGSNYYDGSQYCWGVACSAIRIDDKFDLVVQGAIGIGNVNFIDPYGVNPTDKLVIENGNLLIHRSDQDAAVIKLSGKYNDSGDSFAELYLENVDPSKPGLGRKWTYSHKGDGSLAIGYCDSEPCAGNWKLRLIIDTNGLVSIPGDLAVGGDLSVGGTAEITGQTTLTGGLASCPTVCAASSHGHSGYCTAPCASDLRLKKNVKTLESALDRMLKLRGVEFEWIKPEYAKEYPGTQVGMIAQEVEKVFPQWVQTGQDGYKALSLRGIEGLTVEALRELKVENEKLKAKNSQLEERIKAIEAKLNIVTP